MRNYVIINGVNSLTIQGLAINNLPPITKPMIRTQREEIDGRDGDIVTELGYSAYDKQMEIGLYGNFDIDAIIKYFTGEGTIVFSNEADKYYNFKILDQIDYEKLLKFKTATVTFHCQPFKYPLEEEPVEAEITTLTGTGETITLNNTEEAPMEIVYKGNTYQDSTSGKNLLNIPDGTQTNNGITYVAKDGEITINGTSTNVSFYQLEINIPVTAEEYSWSANNPVANENVTVRFDGSVMSRALFNVNQTWSTTFYSEQIRTYFVIRVASGITLTNFKIKPQFEKGEPTSYEPYTNGPSPNPDYPQDIQVVSGDNSIEVCGKNKFNINGDINTRYDGGTPSNPQNTVLNSDLTTITNTNTFHPFGQKIYVGAGNTIYFSAKLKSVSYSTTPSGSASVGTISIYNDSTPTGRKTLSYTYSELNTYKSDSFTATTDYIYLCFGRSGNVNSTTFTDIMLSSSNDTTYEPYTGASYPINLPVENLFDEELLLNATDWTLNSEGYYTGTSNSARVYFNNNHNIVTYKENTQYAISLLGYYTSGAGIRLRITYTDTTYDETSNFNSTPSKITYITQANKTIDYITINYSAAGTIYIKDFQIEEGSKANSFTPYGQTPIWLGWIRDYQDKFIRNSGKNLLSGLVKGKGISASTGAEETNENKSVSDYIPVDFSKNPNYSLSGLTDKLNSFVGAYNSNKQFLGRTGGYAVTSWALTNSSFSAGTPQGTGDIAYIRVTQYYVAGSTGTIDDIDNLTIMLNEGSTALPYEPYGNGDLYLEKKIGKVVLNGTEDWRYNTTNQVFLVQNFVEYLTTGFTPYSTYFKGQNVSAYAQLNDNSIGFLQGSNNRLLVKDTSYTEATGLANWLSTHNTEVYYVLATPTYTEIEGTLKEQLETIKMSYEGQTNISQTNNDLPFELDVSVTFLAPMEINNIGNIYAKPILTIEGTGNIGVVLNGIQILEIDLSNNGKIAIDVPKLEAYDPDDDTLLNRLVTGDYMKLLINEGYNKITFTGEVSGATLTNYIRWI